MIKIAAYALNFIVGLVSSLLLLPSVISELGVEAWASFAFGQSVGLVAASLVTWGWFASGPPVAALAISTGNKDELKRIVETRFLLFVLAIPPLLAVDFLAPQTNKLLVVSASVSMASTGLSNLWYYIGSREPFKLLFMETAPRSVCLLAAVAVLLITHDSAAFCLLLLLSSALAQFISTRYGLGIRAWGGLPKIGKAFIVLRAQWHLAFSSITSQVYLTLPTIFVGVVEPKALAIFACAERVAKFAQLGFGPFVNKMQGELAESSTNGTFSTTAVGVRRQGFVLAAIAFTGVSVMSNFVAGLLSASKISISGPLGLAFGITVFASLSSQISGSGILGAKGSGRAVSRSALIGAVTWLLIGPVLWFQFGIIGCAYSVAFAELCVMFFQQRAVSKLLLNLES